MLKANQFITTVSVYKTTYLL